MRGIILSLAFCASHAKRFVIFQVVATDSELLRTTIHALKAEVAAGSARAAADQALIAPQQLQIANLRHALYGQRSERASRLIEKMEFGLEEAKAIVTEDEIAAEQAAGRTTNLAAFTRKRPSRRPYPSTCHSSV